MINDGIIEESDIDSKWIDKYKLQVDRPIEKTDTSREAGIREGIQDRKNRNHNTGNTF